MGSSQLCKFVHPFVYLFILLLLSLHHHHLPQCEPRVLSVSCLNDIKTLSPDRRWKTTLRIFFPTPLFHIWLLSICNQKKEKQKRKLFRRLQIRFCLFEQTLILLFLSPVMFMILISPEMVFPMSTWIRLLHWGYTFDLRFCRQILQIKISRSSPGCSYTS